MARPLLFIFGNRFFVTSFLVTDLLRTFPLLDSSPVGRASHPAILSGPIQPELIRDEVLADLLDATGCPHSAPGCADVCGSAPHLPRAECTGRLLIWPDEVLSGMPDPLVLKVTAHTLG